MEGKENRVLELSFDLNTIDHLGVKLYTTIPPMIAELISNAWDADAHNVKINFNDKEKKSILIKDDGSGMTFDELNNNFLKVGRNRRTEEHKDTTKEGRPVLGKKGLGKLSMFGISKRITISTVKNGIKNTFMMDYDDIKNQTNGLYRPKVIDIDLRVDEENGTSILIDNISKKTPFDIKSISDSLQERFTIFSKDFIIYLTDNTGNDITIDSCEAISGQYQFTWDFPEDYEKLLSDNQTLLDFARKNEITGSISTSLTPLRVSKRGITLFSRGKLVQENDVFHSRGNDNFFQYMTGTFQVDFVDNDFEVDNCSTDRKAIAWDNYDSEELGTLKELMEKLVKVTEGIWRKSRRLAKEEEIKKTSFDINSWIQSLNPAEKPLAKKLTNAILENNDIDQDTATTYLSCIKDMYSFESFKNFTQELDDMDSLDDERAIKLLIDWNNIESKEYAKIALGRISTIEQFDKYIKENASETKVLQKFLEEFPWLLDPKMSKFEREVTYSKLLKDNYDDSNLPASNRRIDFLCTAQSGIVHIIELKRPNIKLTAKELQQIAEYVEFIRDRHPQSVKNVLGFLVSDNMSYEPGSHTIRVGLETQGIFVKSYSDLLMEAKNYNKVFIDTFEEIAQKKND